MNYINEWEMDSEQALWSRFNPFSQVNELHPGGVSMKGDTVYFVLIPSVRSMNYIVVRLHRVSRIYSGVLIPSVRSMNYIRAIRKE